MLCGSAQLHFNLTCIDISMQLSLYASTYGYVHRQVTRLAMHKSHLLWYYSESCLRRPPVCGPVLTDIYREEADCNVLVLLI